MPARFRQSTLTVDSQLSEMFTSRTFVVVDLGDSLTSDKDICQDGIYSIVEYFEGYKSRMIFYFLKFLFFNNSFL